MRIRPIIVSSTLASTLLSSVFAAHHESRVVQIGYEVTRSRTCGFRRHGRMHEPPFNLRVHPPFLEHRKFKALFHAVAPEDANVNAHEQHGLPPALMATSARVVKLSPARLRVFFTRLPFITRLIFLINVAFGLASLIFSSLPRNSALIPSKVSIWSGTRLSQPCASPG